MSVDNESQIIPRKMKHLLLLQNLDIVQHGAREDVSTKIIVEMMKNTHVLSWMKNNGINTPPNRSSFSSAHLQMTVFGGTLTPARKREHNIRCT
jgi:hypothetical protein